MDKEEFLKINVINDFISYISKKNYSINTYTSYINDLYYFTIFVKKDLTKVTFEDVKDYLEHLNLKKEKSSSVRRKISSLKSFYKFLYKNGYMDKKDYPLTKVAYPKMEKKLPKFIYYNDLLEIINESTKDKDGVRDRLIIEMLYATGVRVSELVNIKINDIDFNNRRIIVLGKGNKERIVYYGEYAEEVLKEYLKTHDRKNHNYLFVNAKGGQLTDRGVRYIIDNIISCKIIYNIQKLSKEIQFKQIIKKDDTERITKLVQKQIEKSMKLLDKRLIHAFPHLEILKLKKKKK